MFQVRKYGLEVSDYAMVNGWWREHVNSALPEVFLPPDGFILERDGEPICAAWIYLSAGVGVAFLEWVVAKPGMELGEAREALFTLMDFMKQYARDSDYGVIWCNTVPAIARYMRRCGFTRLPVERVSMICRTEEDKEDVG